MISVIHRASVATGQTSVPGDKSITHRALLLGALADGTTAIDGFLDAGDCRSTVDCLRTLGVGVEQTGRQALRIQGHGMFEIGRASCRESVF